MKEMRVVTVASRPSIPNVLACWDGRTVPVGFPFWRPIELYGSARIVSIAVCAVWAASVRSFESFCWETEASRTPARGAETTANIVIAIRSSTRPKPSSADAMPGRRDVSAFNYGHLGFDTHHLGPQS